MLSLVRQLLQRLRDGLNTLSVHNRIVAYFAGLVGTVSLLGLLVFPKAIEMQAERSLAAKAASIGAMVAHSVRAGMVFQDTESIREALEAAFQSQDLRHVEVTAQRGEVLVHEYMDAPPPGDGVTTHRGWESDNDVLGLSTPVILNEEPIGEVHVDLSRAAIRADVAAARSLIALVSCGLFLLGLVAARLIARRIVAPLKGVAETAERIADGDLESRAHAPTDDEIGQLAQSFNTMVDRVQATQDRLLHSQRMESVGQLAGGIAHDFNNLLTTIMGNADMLMMDLPADHPGREDVQEIQKAGERAAGLTGQLLAFTRQQVSQPKVLSLNEAVSGVEKMLNRLVGERHHLTTDLDPSVSNVMADLGQMEQVLVNLVVNARDAMPDGGRVEVGTGPCNLLEPREHRNSEIPPGEYTVLSVRDWGVGMDEVTLDRIFEPFFTQKEAGKGTGLGLATVYGIVQQGHGFVHVDSALGEGTTVSVFLPAVGAPVADSDCDTGSADAGAPVAKGETILLVEDQDDVRALACKMLERLDYRVLAASGGEEALRLIDDPSVQVDLVLTDVVMPGMTGTQLTAALAARGVETAIIYMSGYVDGQLQEHGVLEEGVILIEKPFTIEILGETIREVLDASDTVTRVLSAV